MLKRSTGKLAGAWTKCASTLPFSLKSRSRGPSTWTRCSRCALFAITATPADGLAAAGSVGV
eukprot:8432605-Alexandrium_andersonii.AAC.1